MDSSNSRIKHDYKPLLSSHRIKKVEWFVAGLALPFLVLMLGLALHEPNSEARKQLPASGENATSIAIPAIPTIPELPGDPLPIAAPLRPADNNANPELEALYQKQSDHEQLEIVIRRGDSLDVLFKKHGLNRSDLARIMRLPEAKNTLRILKPGDIITLAHDAGDIHSLNRRVSETLSISVNREDEGFKATMLAHPIEYRTNHAHAAIESSLFEAGQTVGISNRMIMDLAGIFAWDVDFVLDIRVGDEFTLIYEEIWQDGLHIRDGEILAAEFINRGKSYRALRYKDPGGNTNYFTPEGRSVRKAFLRAPVDFSRISSNFNLRRRHPVLNRIRAHKGVDYAARSGTPVKAAGDGKVIFRGRKGGYGNAVLLQHGGNITTLYGHLSRFGKYGHGTRVRQGQVIGYVGRTGLATGDHLHYEYRLNGVHRNPRTVKLPQAAPIRQEYKEEFFGRSGPLLARLDLLRRTQLAVGPIPSEGEE